MLNSTRQCQNLFLACWQSSFNEFALQQLPKQSQWAECLQCWDSKALILGQDIRHSLSFHVSTETLFSFYVTSHVFEWATTTDCLGLHRLMCGLQYHSTSCSWVQMEPVQLWCEQVPPTVTAAPCFQRCPCMLVIFGLLHHLKATHLVYRPALAVPKNFLLVTQSPREEPKRESRLVEVDLTRAEVDHGMSKSWCLIRSSLEWFIPWPSSRGLARGLISRCPNLSFHIVNYIKSFIFVQQFILNLCRFEMCGVFFIIKSRLLFLTTVATHRHILFNSVWSVRGPELSWIVFQVGQPLSLVGQPQELAQGCGT